MTEIFETTCCGKEMRALGSVDMMNPYREQVKGWLCAECGHCIDLVDYWLDEEDLKNLLVLHGQVEEAGGAY
jgi:hypothetical protein